MFTAPAASGWWPAQSVATAPPSEWPTTTGRSAPRSATTRSTSSTRASQSQAPSPERPWQRRSQATTRWRLVNSGTNASQLSAFPPNPCSNTMSRPVRWPPWSRTTSLGDPSTCRSSTIVHSSTLVNYLTDVVK